ncbi:MAG: hypothetical protein WCR19_01480 [Acholeplasmataceae bacterium]
MLKFKTKYLKISTTFFLAFHFIYFILNQGYASLLSWLFLIVSIIVVYFMFMQVDEKNYKKTLFSIIAYYIVYALFIYQSFIDYPIPFDNVEQIVFTIGINFAWLCIYIYVMYHKDHEDAKHIFYIVTLILFLFESFSNSTRLISFVRGYMTRALTPFIGFLLVVFIILMTITTLLTYYLYLEETKEKLNIKMIKKI